MAASVLSLLHFGSLFIFRCVAVSGAREQVYARYSEVESAGTLSPGDQYAAYPNQQN
jgi:hypothetical protein